MISLCPLCYNVLQIGTINKSMKLHCNTCPFIYNITSPVTLKTYCKLKEVDEILIEGAEAWKNVDATEKRCPKCDYPRAYFMQVQIKSADEPMTTFYKCCNHACQNNWQE